MALSRIVESRIEEIYVAYDLLAESNDTCWVRQRDIAELVSYRQSELSKTLDILIALGEFERYEVHTSHVRYKHVGCCTHED